MQYASYLFAAAIVLAAIAAGGWGFTLLRRRRLAAMLEMLPQEIALVNRQGRILLMTNGGRPGPPPDIRHVSQLPQPAQALFRRAIDDVFATGKPVEFDYVCDGRTRRVTFSAAPPLLPFGSPSVIWMADDIADPHRVQLSHHYRQALEAVYLGVIIADENDRITLMNPAACDLTGFPSGEAAGMRLGEVFRIEDPETDPGFADDRLDGFRKVILRCRDGSRRRIREELAQIRGEEGTFVGKIIIFRDIGEDAAKLDQMLMNRRLLDTTIEAAKLVYFRIDREMKLIYASSTKYWPVEKGTVVSIAQWVSPEDAAALQAKWEALRDGEIASFEHAYSVVTKGRRKYFQINISQFQNAITGQYEYCGTLQDVTTIRESEMHYRDNLRLLETVTKHMPGAFFVKDVKDNFRYLLCNEQFIEVTGCPREGIIGRRDREIFNLDENAAEKFIADDRALVAGETDIDVQEQFVGRSGQRYTMRTIKKVVSCADGRQLLLGMALNITRQCELEQQQKKTIDRLNEYIESDRILYQALSEIAVMPKFDDAIDGMLHSIGEFSGADLCAVFHYLDRDRTQAVNICEWCREGVAPLYSGKPANDVAEFRPWHQTLLERRSIVLSDLENPSPGFENAAEKLRKRAFRSVLACGIWIDDNLHGFISLYFRNRKEFSECEIRTINGIAQLYRIAYEISRQRAAAEDTASLQRQIVDNIPLPVTIIDLDYHILSANPSALDNIKKPLEELLGTQCFATACRQGAPPEFCPVRRTLRSGEPCRIEHDFHDRRLLASAQPIFDRDGNMKYILTVDVDITEMAKQKKELQTAMEQAQAADRAKSCFLATISHELRTPLNAVIGFSELLQQDGVTPEDREEYLRSISFAGNALLNLVNDILDLSKLAADQVTLEPTLTDVEKLIREVGDVFRLRSIKNGVDLKIAVSDVRHALFIDNLRLRQILFNLLGNAFKFTDAGRIEIEAATAVSQESGKASLVLRVRDTGIGISREGQKNIFEPFVQDAAVLAKRRYEGTGLGLAIIKRLLDKMGGAVELESEPGTGSTFRVRLDGLDYRDASSSAVSAPEENAPALKPQRLLLVDDVPLNLKVLSGMLRKLDMECTSAASASEALEILDRDNRYDAILTDMWMPELSGGELAERLGKDPRCATIPVYVVTADTQVNEPDLFAGVLHKPLTLDALRELSRAIEAKKT